MEIFSVYKQAVRRNADYKHGCDNKFKALLSLEELIKICVQTVQECLIIR